MKDFIEVGCAGVMEAEILCRGGVSVGVLPYLPLQENEAFLGRYLDYNLGRNTSSSKRKIMLINNIKL